MFRVLMPRGIFVFYLKGTSVLFWIVVRKEFRFFFSTKEIFKRDYLNWSLRTS